MNRRTRKGFLSKFFSSKVCLCPRQRPLIHGTPPRCTGYGCLRSCRHALQWILTSTQWRGGEEERRRGGVGFKGWSTDCSGSDAKEEECNLCGSISSRVVGSERQFSICTFVKVTHVPLLANWSVKLASNETTIRAFARSQR